MGNSLADTTSRHLLHSALYYIGVVKVIRIIHHHGPVAARAIELEVLKEFGICWQMKM